jgi:DNA-directed RNA polymerase subunit RPC12/RpoP
MTPEAYVIGSIVVAVIVVAMLSGSESIDDEMKCPRCEAEMQIVGGSGGCIGIHVVPRILVVTCPQCGYSERSWAC